MGAYLGFKVLNVSVPSLLRNYMAKCKKGLFYQFCGICKKNSSFECLETERMNQFDKSKCFRKSFEVVISQITQL